MNAKVNHAVENITYTILDWIVKIIEALDGKFGRRVLKPKYRRVWRWITWGTTTILFIIYIVIPFFEFWERVVRFINYVRWGV